MNKIIRIAALGVVGLVAGCASIPIQVQPPDIHVYLSQSQIEPGHALRLIVQSEPELAMRVCAWGQQVVMQATENSGGYQAYLAVPLETQADVYTVSVTARREHEILRTQSLPVTVLERSPFKTVRLWIKYFGKYDFETESVVMTAYRQQVESRPDMKKLIVFRWPLQGRISEIFGVKRIYNKGLKMWYHGGLDIAAPGGTEIKAPASGIVILTREFAGHGNTTLIHHGFGVVSTYLHQSKILVKEGQVVSMGDVIGEVGTTGSSTGNHLHFQINIHNIKVDPMDFLDETAEIFEAHKK
ncbi:M23 family metallopeptidase [bacterium]|nr:M23 family metallopeptidase [bacterium]